MGVAGGGTVITGGLVGLTGGLVGGRLLHGISAKKQESRDVLMKMQHHPLIRKLLSFEHFSSLRVAYVCSPVTDSFSRAVVTSTPYISGHKIDMK